MFKRSILVTDLSSAAFAVVKDIASIRTLGVEEILLLQCLGERQASDVAVTYATAALVKNLKEQQRLLEEQGFKVEARVVPGLAKREVKRIADEENYSLIMAGAETCTLINEPLIGGIAYELIHYCRKPILLIRISEAKEEGTVYYEAARANFPEHVLFPTDFSTTSYTAFEVIKELAAAGTKKITLMHVQEQSRIDPYLLQQLSEFNERDEVRLARMKQSLQEISDVVIDTVLFYGSPSRYIIDAVDDRNIQLVVMGSQGRGYVNDLILGSVGHNVARHSKASVLLIPARN